MVDTVDESDQHNTSASPDIESDDDGMTTMPPIRVQSALWEHVKRRAADMGGMSASAYVRHLMMVDMVLPGGLSKFEARMCNLEKLVHDQRKQIEELKGSVGRIIAEARRRDDSKTGP